MAETTFTKDEVLQMIKSVDIKQLTVPLETLPPPNNKEALVKWFKFGAYDALKTLSENIKNHKPEAVKK